MALFPERSLEEVQAETDRVFAEQLAEWRAGAGARRWALLASRAVWADNVSFYRWVCGQLSWSWTSILWAHRRLQLYFPSGLSLLLDGVGPVVTWGWRTPSWWRIVRGRWWRWLAR